MQSRCKATWTVYASGQRSGRWASTPKRYVYTMNGHNIESVSEEKDLGVWVEEDSKPSKQCKMAAQSANWALGQMTRAFHYRKAECLVPLYKTFIRPKLEHAVGAWSPWLEGDREALERVQKRLVRMIFGQERRYI